MESFTNFSFTWWNFGYHGAFHKLFFHMMEFRLSWSLSRIFLSRDGLLAVIEPFTNFSFIQWNFGYHGAFHDFFFHTMEFWLSRSLSRTFLSHDGISATTEPFTNFFFTQWNFGYHGAFHKFSHGRTHKAHDLGEDSFHIYYNEYLHRILLVKNLASWFRAPLQGKEYGPPYSKVIAKIVNVFVPEITYRLMIWIFWISTECILTKKNAEK
jgi:hypothetical protein